VVVVLVLILLVLVAAFFPGLFLVPLALFANVDPLVWVGGGIAVVMALIAQSAKKRTV
jgi:general stress protein CsbA